MEAIGERLRHKREELGLTLEQAAETTKFPPEIIEAVEEGRLGVFSAKVYHVAFIRAYARLLKLDADQLVRDQKSEEERAQDALRGIRALPPRPRTPRRALIAVAAVVVVAVIALVVSNFVFREKEAGADLEAGSRGEVGGPEAGRQGISKATPRMIRVETPPEESEPTGDAETGGVASGGATGGLEEEPTPAQAGAGGVGDSVSADSSRSAGPAVVPGTSWPIIPAGPGRGETRPRTLEVAARGGSFVTITSGDSTLFEGALSGGDTRSFTSRKPFVLVFLSDRNAVTLTLDGKPVTLPETDKRQVFDYTLP